jgi:hypothetical protein
MPLPLLPGVNTKSLITTILVMFAYIFGSDFLIHGLWLKQTYIETAALWRSPDEMQSYFPIMLLGQFLIAKFLVMIFVVGYKGGGWKEGARFGLFVGPLFVGTLLIQYTVYPLTTGILISWIVGTMIQSIGGGVVASLVYKK